MFRAVLFDIDGTLVNSNDAHARAWVKAFEEAGIHVEFDKVRSCIGMGGDPCPFRTLCTLCGAEGSELWIRGVASGQPACSSWQ